jgi:hypothetical protein
MPDEPELVYAANFAEGNVQQDLATVRERLADYEAQLSKQN